MTPEQAVFESRLDFFAAHVMQGLCANPTYTSPQYMKFLEAKKMTLETIAVESAIELMEKIEVLKIRLHEAKMKTQSTLRSVDQKLEEIRTDKPK